MSDDSDLQLEAMQANAAAGTTTPRQALPTAPTTVAQSQPQAPSPEQSMGTWRPADGAQPFTVAQPVASPAPSGKSSSLWATAGSAAWEGAMNMGSDALSAASFAARQATQDPTIVGWIEGQRKALDAHIQNYVSSLPADRQNALHASVFGGGDDANGQHIPTPGEVGYTQYAAATLGSLVPDVALAIAPESLVGRLAVKAGMRGAAVVAARMGATGAAFGTDQAGAAYKDLVDGIDHASDTEMMQNPAYAHLRQDQGMDEVSAKQTLVGKAAPLIAAQFGVGAVTGAGVGGLLTHGAMGAAGRGLVGRAGIGAAEGAATMGAQGAAGDYLQQQANMQAGPQQEYDPSQTAHALASGALSGALMGAAGGAIHGGHSPEVAPEAPPNPTSLPDDTHTALQSALQLDLPLNTAGPGTVGANPQGELFRTVAEANQPGRPAPPTAPAPGPTAAPESQAQPVPGQTEMFPQGSAPAPAPQPSSTTVVGPSTPEPNTDIAAQVAALADPNNPKDAVFLAKGTPIPGNLPPGAKVMVRGPGTLVTTNADKAKLFARGPIDEGKMAKLLDYPQNKTDAIASGNAQVVQGKDAQGNVVHESLAGPDAVPAAVAAAQAQAPHVEITTPEAAQQRRADLTSETATSDHPVDVAAHSAEDPTPAQAEAGNYQMGHVNLHGLNISVETPKGGIRRGPTDPATGQPAWQTTMPAHYGYVRGSRGADGDHVDVSLGSRTNTIFDGRPEDAAKEPVFVVDQIDPATGKFDEHKAMVGFHTQVEAERAYDASFSDGSGPSRRGATNEMQFGDFKDWLDKGNTKSAISYKPPNKGDVLRAKRAAEKARMNPAPVEVKSTAATMGEGSEIPLHNSDQARADAAAKIPEVARIVQVKKGADVRPIMTRIIRDLTDRIGKTDGTPDQIGESLKQWMDGAPKGPIPGTTTGYRQIGEHLTRLLTGKDVERPGIRAEALAETRQVGRDSKSADVEDKLAESGGKLDADEAKAELAEVDADRDSLTEQPATTVAEPEGGESSAGLTQDYGAEKKRSAQTTNQERILSDLEHQVTQGMISPSVADAMYGRKPDGQGGRKRAYPTFADWVRSRIASAEDPAAEKALVEKAASTLADKSLTAKDREKLTKQFKAEIAKHDPEYLERLRDALRELEDPVGAAVAPERKAYNQYLTKPGEVAANKLAVDALNGDITVKDALAGLERMVDEGTIPQGVASVNASRLQSLYHAREITPAIKYQRAVNDPATNAAVDKLLAAREPSTLHNYLDAILADPTLRRQAEPVVALARRLRMITPDIKVMNYDQAEARFGEDYNTPQNAGIYHPAASGREAFIAMHPDAPMSRVETVLHEALHSVTSRYLDRLPPGHVDRLALDSIRNELQDVLDQGGLSDREQGELEYALSDRHELHTMLLSNPTVQRIAANHTPSADFVKRMNRLGYVGQAARSVWSYFTAFVRRALGMPAQGTDTVLDRVLRPLQDITDRAAAYGKSTNEALDAASHALPQLTKVRDDAISKLDVGGIGETGRRALLAGATTDGIVKWNRDLFESRDLEAPGNSLEDYRSATEAVAAHTAAFHDKYADQVRNLVGRVSGPERDKLASLMVDATTADARIGSKLAADANDHLTKPDQKAALRALQARYDALSPAGRGTYEGMRDYFRETYRAERDAQIRSMVKTALPDATNTQIQKVTEAARTKGGIERLIAGTDDDPIAAAFGDAWNSSRKIVQGIGQAHSMGFVQGDYFPLRRFGDYVVRYGDKGSDDYGVEMFEKLSAAEARRSELLKQGTAGVSQVLSKRTSKLRDVLPTTVVDEVVSAMERRGGLAEHADQMRDLMNSVLLQHATHSEATRTGIRRQGVKGASTDMERSLARDFLSTASRMGYLEHGPARMQALEQMQRHADWLGRNGGAGEQRRAQQVLNELQLRMPSGDDASGALTGLARKFTTLGFVQSLMSPSHMITSSIEAHMNSTSLLGARHGAVQAGVALTKALRDVSPVMMKAGARNTLVALGKGLKSADWNLSNVVRDRLIAHGANKANMTDLFDHLNRAGLVDHSMVREMQRIANPRADVTRGWWQKFMDFNAAGAHAVDVANKTAIAKAAYDLELRKTGSHDAAVRYAVDTARQAMPNYNLANKARISTDKGPLGGFAGPLTQFKQYGLHMYSVMANLVHTSLAGATSQERVEARKAFAGILATHALMAGSLTLIGDPLRYIGGAYDWITGASKPHDYENDVRRWIADAFGPELGEVVSRGLPHAAGIDIHRRVGLTDLLEVPELNSFDAKGFKDMLVSAMTGAAGEDAATMAGGLTKLRHGDIAGGLQDLVPRVIRDPMKAARLAEAGVTDSKRKTVLPPDRLSTGDIVAQGLGFQPAQVSEFREGRAAVMEEREEMNSARLALIQGFVAASPDDRTDAIANVQQWNMTHPTHAVTYSQLLQAQRRARKAAAEARQQQTLASFGVKLRKGVTSQAGAFANVQ